jgi:hypothetical protein
MVDKVVTEFQSERNRRKRKSDLLYLVLILISAPFAIFGLDKTIGITVMVVIVASLAIIRWWRGSVVYVAQSAMRA